MNNTIRRVNRTKEEARTSTDRLKPLVRPDLRRLGGQAAPRGLACWTLIPERKYVLISARTGHSAGGVVPTRWGKAGCVEGASICRRGYAGSLPGRLGKRTCLRQRLGLRGCLYLPLLFWRFLTRPSPASTWELFDTPEIPSTGRMPAGAAPGRAESAWSRFPRAGKHLEMI